MRLTKKIGNDLKQLKFNCLEELKELDGQDSVGDEVIDSLSDWQLTNYCKDNYVAPRDLIKRRRKILSRIRDLEATLAYIKVKERKLVTESKDLTTMMVGSADETKENTENLLDFVGNKEDMRDVGSSISVNVGQNFKLALQDYLRRPVIISAGALNMDADINLSFAVWDLYTLDSAVRSKLKNFAFCKADLHVRVAISGTPFNRGKLLLSYQPYVNMNNALTAYHTMMGTTPEVRPCMLTYLSQAYGSVVMDIKENQPVEMKIPFIFHKPVARLFNSSSVALSDVTSYSDFADMGNLYLYSINRLFTVGTSNVPCSYSIYAWFENVELTGTTGSITQITTESKDERITGPVEKIATRAATFVSSFEQVPTIGLYAKASNILFSGVAKAAAALGWSKPNIITQPIFVKNMGATCVSQGIGFDTSYKMSLDHKQETSVDPRACGIEQDDMMIDKICSIDAYMGSYEWDPDLVDFSGTVMKIPVTPCLAQRSLTSNELYAPSPVGFCSQLFHYWRGDITYRVEVVASSFHRGKLAIIYDPNPEQNTLIISNTNLNKQFIKILDISESQAIEFTVKWCSAYPWLETLLGLNMAVVDNIPANEHHLNGWVYVVPINRLTSPDDSTIAVNLYMRSDNMHFNQVVSAGYPLHRTILTESRSLSQTPVTSCVLNDSSADEKHISELYFGEEPLSFRVLLKRFNTTNNSAFASAASASITTASVANVPIFDPPFAVSSTVSYRTIIGYLRPAYLGLRGTVRWKCRPWDPLNSLTTPRSSVAIASWLAPEGYTINTATANTGLTTQGITYPLGNVLFFLDSNACVEYEAPLYTNNSYVYACDSELGQVSDFNDAGVFNETWSRRSAVGYLNSAVTGTVTALWDWAAGEDFCLMRFLGAPYFTEI